MAHLRDDRWAVVLAVAVTAGLAGFRLGTPSLWFDEAVSVIVADGDLAHLYTLAAETEASGSLYYLLLSVWMNLGRDEWVLRSLSLLIALLTVPAFHLLGRQLVSGRTAAIATILLAANAMFVAYARELRGYSLVVLLTVVAGYGFVRALREGAPRWWALWALAGTAAVYAHLFGALVMASQALVAAVVVRGTRQWQRAAIAAGVSGTLMAPMVAFVLTTDGEQLDWVPPLDLSSLAILAVELTGAQIEMPGPVSTALPAMLFAVAGAWRLTRPALTADGDREPAPPWLVIGSWLVVPVAGAALLSLVVQPVFYPRYFIVVLPALLLLVAAGIAALTARTALVAALAVVMAVGVPSILADYDQADPQNWRAAVASAMTRWKDGDAMLITACEHLPPLDYYAQQTTPAGAPPVPLYDTEGAECFLDGYSGRPAIIDYAHVTGARQIDAHRLWKFDSFASPPRHPAQRAVPGWSVSDSWLFSEVRLRLLQPVGG